MSERTIDELGPVDYLVVEFPAGQQNFTGEAAEQLLRLHDSGVIRVSARRAPHRVVIEVADPGRGVPDSDKDKLFLPYFSTKGRGTGLGLAIVHRIVRDHDGQIHVHDNQPRGTRFEIELPA